MKKYFALLAVSAIFMSCSDNDIEPVQQDEPFFNLAEGNYWMYKRYSVTGNTTEALIGSDSVVVTGQEIIEGIPYYKLEHWTSANSQTEATLQVIDHQRVNEQGHLVRPNGYVIHPGYDNSYIYTGPVANNPDLGSLSFTVADNVSISIEGHNYNVVPYTGYYTPSPTGAGGPEGIGAVYSYQSGLGEVVRRCRFIGSYDHYWEFRLASYHIN